MPATPTAYDRLGPLYDAWCRSVVEDIAHYVDLAIVSGGPTLEIGVGTGRIAVPTALAGVRVVGVDSSPTMLELARRRAEPHGVALELHLADMLHLPDLGRFPLVTIPFRALLHLPDDARRLTLLRALRDRLEPGGRLAFDVFHPHPMDIAETHRRWIEREPGISEYAMWEPERQRLVLTVRAHGRQAEMELWWLQPERWRELLVEAGFTAIQCYGWFDRRPPRSGDADSVWVAG